MKSDEATDDEGQGLRAHLARGWSPGNAGAGLLIADHRGVEPRLVMWIVDADGRPTRDRARAALGVAEAQVAAFLKVYTEGIFTLMPGPAGAGANEAPLREIVGRTDRRLRPASRWDSPR